MGGRYLSIYSKKLLNFGGPKRQTKLIVRKKMRHWRMQFETPARSISFLYQRTHQGDSNLIRIHFHAMVSYLSMILLHRPIKMLTFRRADVSGKNWNISLLWFVLIPKYSFCQFADFSYQLSASATPDIADMTRQNTTTPTTSVIFFSPAISPRHIFDRAGGGTSPGRHLRLSGGKKKNACDFSDETSHA